MSTEISQRKVLYIEDNLMNRELVQFIFEELPEADLITAENAEEGISKATSNPPDLILMDIDLPGLDGLAATKIIRRQSETRDIPIIALSAAAMKRDIDKALEVGILEYVTKPIIIPEFLDLIRRVLSIAR